MVRSAPFRAITSAPRDGTAIEVQHGPEQAIARAEWSGQAQAWVLLDDPLRKTLHRVTGWRPAPERTLTTDDPVPTAVLPVRPPRQRALPVKTGIVTTKKPRRR